ncbi:MAG: helix-turn-helix domain-containing protein [Rectinemataceae bacterium]
MSEAFESIMRGLAEVKAHREGKLKLKTTTIEIAPLPHCDAKTVKQLRAELGLSQSIFATALGVSKKTIEAWESGHNVPSGSACRLLEVIGKDMDLLKREKIVVYHAPAAGVQPAKAKASKPRAPKAPASKPRSSKAALPH